MRVARLAGCRRDPALAADPVEARRHALRAVRLAPWEVDARLVAIRAAVTTATPAPGQPELATLLNEGEAAVSVAPGRPSARDARARVRLMAGDLPGAWSDWREAERAHPRRQAYATARREVEEVLRQRAAAARARVVAGAPESAP